MCYEGKHGAVVFKRKGIRVAVNILALLNLVVVAFVVYAVFS
jgi:hypothetical protein